MRDPMRLYKFYDEVRKIHMETFPDWRYGQFTMNFFGWLMAKKGIDGFFPEEDKMLEYMKEYARDEK